MTLVFSLLPGVFGLNNFKKVATKLNGIAATGFYHAVWFVHVLAIYNVWNSIINIWWSIIGPVILVVIYFSTVGRNLSTG